MAVFITKSTQVEEPRQLRPAPLSEPERRHRAHPSRRQGQGTLVQIVERCARHPHPRIRQGASASMRARDSAAKTSPTPPAPVTRKFRHPRRHRVREACRADSTPTWLIQALPRCHTEATGVCFPAEMPGPLSVRPSDIKAYVVHLLIAQITDLAQTRRPIDDAVLIGQLLSEATLLGYDRPTPSRVAEWERQVIERLLREWFAAIKEILSTSGSALASVAKESLRFTSTQPRRSPSNASNIPNCSGARLELHRHHPALRRRRGARHAGPDMSARYLNNSYTHCEHALCGSHLRELTFIVDAHDYAWAKRMKRLLLDACHEVAIQTERERAQGRTETLPHHPHPGRARDSADSTASKGPTRQGRHSRDAHNLWRRSRMKLGSNTRRRRAALRQASQMSHSPTTGTSSATCAMSKVTFFAE